MYINSKTVNNGDGFKQVQKQLPRNRKSYFLYESKSAEDHFRERYYNIKYEHLMNKNIEGIYETKMPLTFRALIDIGCVVRPKKTMIPRTDQALGRTYKISELENKPPGPNDPQYLSSGIYERIYLLHSTMGARHFWGLFIEATKEI